MPQRLMVPPRSKTLCEAIPPMFASSAPLRPTSGRTNSTLPAISTRKIGQSKKRSNRAQAKGPSKKKSKLAETGSVSTSMLGEAELTEEVVDLIPVRPHNKHTVTFGRACVPETSNTTLTIRISWMWSSSLNLMLYYQLTNLSQSNTTSIQREIEPSRPLFEAKLHEELILTGILILKKTWRYIKCPRAPLYGMTRLRVSTG